MAKSNNQKAKLLYLKEMLEQEGEGRPVSMQEILDRLAGKGIQAERKSIYDDLEALRSFGMDVKYKRGKQGGYYLAGQRGVGENAALSQPGPSQETAPSQGAAPDRKSWKEKSRAKQRLEKQMKLRCENSLRGQVQEYFGGDARYGEKEPGYFTVTSGLLEGREFYGWLCSMGKGVRIVKPKKAAQSYREYLRTLAREYKGIS